MFVSASTIREIFSNRLIDLTLPLQSGGRGVSFESATTIDRDGWNARTLHLYSHAGTHTDAPTHFFHDEEIVGGLPAKEQTITACHYLTALARHGSSIFPTWPRGRNCTFRIWERRQSGLFLGRAFCCGPGGRIIGISRKSIGMVCRESHRIWRSGWLPSECVCWGSNLLPLHWFSTMSPASGFFGTGLPRGSASSKMPNTSMRSFFVVIRSKWVEGHSQALTNCPPQPGCEGSSGVPLRSQPTEGVSPILISSFLPTKKSPSAPCPATCCFTNSLLLHGPFWVPPVNQPR